MPEEMLKMACRSGLEHWAARKEAAASGSVFAEKDPGTRITSNCGAFANEF
jgi:hypothetical protein